MRYKYMLFFIFLLMACGKKRPVDVSFYYWKTNYKNDRVEQQYLKTLKAKKIFVRISDVMLKDMEGPVPRAPITFSAHLPDSLAIVPVVFIENEVFTDKRGLGLDQLAANVFRFVQGKVAQSGQPGFQEIQIDCDWNATSKAKYFNFLKQLKAKVGGITLSATLRLHQLKNQSKMGIPPVDKVLLMCYNMGNLRKYGSQNSILDVPEFKKYANENLSYYQLPIDIALPLFSWSAIFRNNLFLGISYQANLKILKNPDLFTHQENGLYKAKRDLQGLKIKKDDEVRYETSGIAEIKELSKYLNKHLSEKPINLVFYHLDHQTITNYPTYELEEISNFLR